MPSTDKTAKVCPKCYLGSGLKDICDKCGGPTRIVNFGKKITVPKKNDKKAWKRVLNGEIYWDRRKKRRHGNNHGEPMWDKHGKPGTRSRFLGWPRKTKDGPDVDLGG